MSFEIQHNCYRRVFVLPKEVVENHIKLAGALQLKVLLWLFYHQGVVEDPAEIAADLGATASDIQDALQYWVVNGMVIQNKDTAEDTVSAPAEQPKVAVVSSVNAATQKSQKPSRGEIAKRGAESPEVAWLLSEAQSKFNRTLTFSEASTLVWLMDTYGLSPAIVIMVIEYAVSVDSCNIRYIEKTAISWYNNEINSVAKAEEYLTKKELARNNWNTVRRTFGMDQRKATKQEEIYVERWMVEWGFSIKMLREAYDRCVNNTGKINFNYINKILEKWHASGFKKPEDIEEEVPAKGKTNGGLKRASQQDASFDIDEIQRIILTQGGE